MKKSDDGLYLKGKIINNKVILDDFELIERVLTPYKDKELEVRLNVLTKKRSTQLNRYYWGAVVPAIKYWHKETQGETLTSTQVHVFNLIKIEGYKITQKNILGVDVFTVDEARSSNMTQSEFMYFLEKIRLYYSEIGLDIPEPTGNSLINDFLKSKK